MNTRQRELLMIALGIVFLVTAALAVVWYLSLATLTVTTDDSANRIKVRRDYGTRQEQITVNQDGKRAQLQLAAGTYIITVQNFTKSSVQVVTLKAGEHKDIMINTKTETFEAVSSEVTSYGAGNTVASHDTLRFIDRNSGDRPLYSVDSHGRVSVLDKKTRYTNVKWAGTSFGIGYGINRNNKYVFTKIEGNSVETVVAPFTVSVTSSYGVAPDKSWYISDGHTVYRANADGSFLKVYSTDEEVAIVSTSNDALLLSQKPPQSTREGALAILHTNGDLYKIGGEAYEAAWSPSGKKLVTSGDTSKIFDGKFNVIGTLPSGNFLSPVWLDEDTIIFGVANKVMRYELSSGKATTLLSFDPVAGTPSHISVNEEGDAIYVAVQKGGDRPNLVFRLEKISLKGGATTKVPVDKLNLLIPNTIRGCNLNYMNFTRFSIIIDYVSSPKNCVPAIKDYITSYKIPLADIGFQVLK